MSEHGGCDGGAARLIRTDQLVRPVVARITLANDNRRRAERGAVSLARAVVGAAPLRPPIAGTPAERPSHPEPMRAVPPSPLATSWLQQSLALWSGSLGMACRLPPVASGLAIWRAWSELGLTGVASCASVAASGAELVGAALAGVLGAAAPRRRSRSSS